MNDGPWDVMVIGAGPAGLSAAFWLARYRRRVVVLDNQRPRNEPAWAVHGYPGLPDIAPDELRRQLRDQARTAGAVIVGGIAVEVTGEKDRFTVLREGADPIEARRVVLAYGRTDRIPDIEGVEELYGTAIFHCPDCDGPSVAGCRVGVLGHDRPAAALALYLMTWADGVVLLTNGRELDIEPSARSVLERYDVEVRAGAIQRIEGQTGRLDRVILENGAVEVDALFFHWGSDPSSQLGPRVGCECDPGGDLRIDRESLETSVPGVYAAGDIVGRPYLSISAAAEGVRAALAIHRSLLPAEWDL